MLGPLVRRPLYVGAVLGYCAQTFALGGFSYWAPKYISARYTMELDHANYVFGGVLIASGLVGTALGGAWADHRARGKSREEAVKVHLGVCAVSGLLGAPFALASVLMPTATGFFSLIFVCAACLFLSTSPINAAILQSVPVELRASAMAVSIFAIHLLGDLLEPAARRRDRRPGKVDADRNAAPSCRNSRQRPRLVGNKPRPRYVARHPTLTVLAKVGYLASAPVL